MLKNKRQALVFAQAEQHAAAQRFASARHRLSVKRSEFIRNPTNLLIPFTIGALVATKGSVFQKATFWGKVVVGLGKVLVGGYPLFARSRRKKRASILDPGPMP